jgi:transposase-like protein
MVSDPGQAEADLAAGRLGCPHCGGRLAPWSWGSPRQVRQLTGPSARLRPRRARCRGCRRTQTLLPGSCQPRRADATAVIGAALAANARGRGHRAIAAALARPPSTVRRWLRAAREPHTGWLYRRGVEHAAALDPNVLAELTAQPSPLGDALAALAAAATAVRRRFSRHAEMWTVIGVLTGGRLLAPVPSG